MEHFWKQHYIKHFKRGVQINLYDTTTVFMSIFPTLHRSSTKDTVNHDTTQARISMCVNRYTKVLTFNFLLVRTQQHYSRSGNTHLQKKQRPKMPFKDLIFLEPLVILNSR